MAEQEFVIVPPSDTDVSAMALRTDMQFLDPYGSESINRKFFGIVPPGIYRGFKYALPGAMKLRIGLPNEPGTAVVQCNSVCITVQQTKPVDLTVAAGFSGLVVLTGFYQFGVPTKQVHTASTQDAAKIELIAASALKPNQVILYTVNVPAGTTALTAAMITTARRQDVSIAVEADIYQMLTDHIGSPTAHTKAQVGLSNVQNWPATAAVNDASDAKYATAGAVKKAYDLAAAALPKAGGTVGRIKIQSSATHLTLAGENGENPWHFEVAGANGDFKLVETGVASRFSLAKGGAATFASNVTALQAYVSAGQSTAANALTRRDFVLKWSEDNSRLDALKQAGVYIGGATKTDFDTLDVGAHGLYSSGPDGDKSVNRPPAEAWGGSWVGLQSQRVFKSDMLQTTLPFGDAATISFRTRRTNAFGKWISLYSTEFKPTKDDVGLPLVNNWGATAAINDASDVKYATAGAVKKAYDLAAAALPKAGGDVIGKVTINVKNAMGTGNYGLDMMNGAIGGLNQLAFSDPCETTGEGIFFPKTGKIGTSTVGADYDVFRLLDGLAYINGSKFYTDTNKPVKGDVGLGSVNNWPATAAVNDASDVKYATAGAVKKAYDLAATKLASNANAVSATKLATARQINGTNFDGTANITTANWGTARTLTIGNAGKSVNGAGNVAWSLAEIGALPSTEDAVIGDASVGLTKFREVISPGGGQYRTSTSSVAGALKITLPVSWTSTMLSFWVDVFQYATGQTVSFFVSGYNYNSNGGTWSSNPSITQIGGEVEHNVRFGHDGNKCAIYIGETTYKWNYPQVTVRNVQFGYSDFSTDRWNSGWDVGFTATLGTITATLKNRVYSSNNKPTKGDVGLGNVQNWGATAAINDASDTKYATAGAVKKAYDLAAAALPKAGGVVTGVVRFTGANGGISVHPTGDVTGIYNGTGDGASQDKTNLQIKSWYGIGICPTAGSSLAEGLNSIWMNARNGQISTIGEIYAQTDKKVFHQGFTPTSAEVGLGSVQNWPATAAVNDASDAKYATAGAVKKAYDLAAGKLASNANAVSASKWATARTITLTGGATGSVSIDGSANVSLAVTVPPTAHTHTPAQVGLGNVQNWPATAAVNDASDAKYATAGAVKKAYDLAASKSAADHNHPGSWLNPIALGTENLNSLVTPGVYAQNANANTSAALNYPENNAGTLTVTSAAGPQQRYHVYNSSRVYTRAQYGTGGFTPWARDYNTLNKPTAADVGLGNVANKGWNHGPVGDTYAVRDGSADIQVRLLRANYQNESGMSGAIAFRINNSTDNYTRYCSNPAAVRAWLGVPATSHAHTAAQGNSDIVAGGYGQVGTHVLASNVSGATKTIGSTVAGSSLIPSTAGDRHQDGTTLPGTWKCLGYSFGSGGNFDARITLWIRIA